MLYTFIMEFRQGTYVSQVNAKTMFGACKKWAENIDASVVKHFTESNRKKLFLEFSSKENKPSKLNDLRNVFYTGVMLGNHVAHINIVVTY